MQLADGEPMLQPDFVCELTEKPKNLFNNGQPQKNEDIGILDKKIMDIQRKIC